jgi:hypothetical protein
MRELSDEDEEILSGMIDQMNIATANMNRSIDDCLSYVAKSNERINRIEKSAIHVSNPATDKVIDILISVNG